ncbi:myelin P2 protein-like [Lineus longissimus]|uniref:myelin P2 protein-like n=1 Tax=Lineus longissimus TaxID=88925 RepID=UPI002B4E0B11
MNDFQGTWILESTDNFDGYMRKLGVNFIMRKLGNLAKPTQEIKVNDEGEIYIKTITSSTIGKWSELTFKLDQEFDEKTIDGRQVKSLVTKEEEDFVHTQNPSNGGPKTIIRRRIEDGKYIMKLECDGEVCTRTYVKSKAA